MNLSLRSLFSSKTDTPLAPSVASPVLPVETDLPSDVFVKVLNVIGRLEGLAAEHNEAAARARETKKHEDVVIHNRLAEYCNSTATALRDILA